MGESGKDGDRSSQRERERESRTKKQDGRLPKKEIKIKIKQGKGLVPVNLGPLRREGLTRTGLDGFRCLVDWTEEPPRIIVFGLAAAQR